MKVEEAYSILEVDKWCALEDIKRSYRKLCLKYHPDKPCGDTEMFVKIQKAYELLQMEHKQNINFYILFAYFINTLSSRTCRNITLRVDVQLEEIYNKMVKKIMYSYYDDRLIKVKRVVYLELEDWKERYTIEGYGDFNPMTGSYEDLVIEISVKNDAFEHLRTNDILNRNDIYTTVRINLYEHYFGLKRKLSYFNGESISLEWHPHVEGDTEVRPGKGLNNGNLYIFYELDKNRCDMEALVMNKDMIETLFNK